MEEVLRIQKLKEINNYDEPRMTGISITFEGDVQTFNAYKIPLEYLIYNKYNARIGSLIKSYEKQYRPLNAEDPNDIVIIEKFLWQSKPDRNNTTMQSLVKVGQQLYGIVTDKGVIIDGNRRAFLLNKIYRDREKWENHNVDHCQYFIAVILDAGADPREISKLETIYQMGEDEKLDYNPIEKYLRCKDLRDIYKFKPTDIAEMMVEKVSKIEEWLQIMQLMDEYLQYLEYDGIYTRLEKREGQFVDLNRFLKKYQRGVSEVDWGYKEIDLADLKSVCFDYIRAQYEGKEFRLIAQANKRESIFCKGEVWNEFLDRHTEKVESVKEKSIDQIREENPDSDFTKLLEARDNDWEEQVGKNLEENLRLSQSRVEDINRADKPLELLTKSRDALRSIDTDADTFFDDAVSILLKEINKISFEYMKLQRRSHDS